MRACFEADGKYWIRNIMLNNTRRMETAISGRCFKALFGTQFGPGALPNLDPHMAS
jgi:hypothetical protein